MAVFKVEIFKGFGGESWGNVYHLEADDLTEAQTAAITLAAEERDIHLNTVQFLYIRVADIDPGTDLFVTIPLAGVGDNDVRGQMLPLWDTFRVDLTVSAGRPGRKYYRGVLCTEDLTDNNGTIDLTLSGALVANVQAMIDSLEASSPLIEPDEDPFTTAVAWPRVQMRQLHRKRRTSGTPTP